MNRGIKHGFLYVMCLGLSVQAGQSNQDLNEVLLTAVKTQNVAGVRAALRLGAHVDALDSTNSYTPLIWAASLGNQSIVRELLDHKAQVDATTHDGWTALMLASANGHNNVVKLLGNGVKNSKTRGRYQTANLAAQNKEGYTALMWAAINGHAQVVKTLLACGADCGVLDNEGRDVYAHLKDHEDPVTSRAVMQAIQEHFGTKEI